PSYTFLYTDTDTSSTYTLSLHDALPILPRPNPTAYPADDKDMLYTVELLSVSLDEVKANFAKFNMLDDRVEFLKGWFKDTLPTADRKSTRLNSSHVAISYAVFCLKKKKK